MARTTKSLLTAAVAAALMLPLSACIAADVDVVGALGLTVTEDGRPVLVVEACSAKAAGITLSTDREGLADDEENTLLATWTATPPAAGQTQLALHAPQAPWNGNAYEVQPGKGYIATAEGSGDKEVISQVAFLSDDLADLEPGTVYVNASMDTPAFTEMSPEEFTETVCNRRG